jgi:hypothetical protein
MKATAEAARNFRSSSFMSSAHFGYGNSNFDVSQAADNRHS